VIFYFQFIKSYSQKMVNKSFIFIKFCVNLLILTAMVIWSILLVQELNKWQNNRYWYYKSSEIQSKVFYITNICIPEFFAIISLIAVCLGNQYWSQTCAIVIGIFWINDHQRNPELFYYGSALQIAAHALQIAVIVVWFSVWSLFYT
jgi:hypothetical protein